MSSTATGATLSEAALLPLATSYTPSSTVRERCLSLANLMEIARRAGREVEKSTHPVRDTIPGNGHRSSTVDALAQAAIVAAYPQVYDASIAPREWVCNLEFEDGFHTVSGLGFFPSEEQRRNAPRAIIDEIDGTTNMKRYLASGRRGGRPKSAVCIALKSRPDSAIIDCGAVYAIDEGVTFGGFFAEGEYIAMADDTVIRVGECDHARGDSSLRVIVANYSNRNHSALARLNEAIEQGIPEQSDTGNGKCEVYGGCRSSTIDVIDIIRNQYDAYVDCRELWTRNLDDNSVLRMYDIAAVLPIARGAGLKIVRPDGTDLSLNVQGHAPLSVIIGRPSVVDKIVAGIKRVLTTFKD